MCLVSATSPVPPPLRSEREEERERKGGVLEPLLLLKVRFDVGHALGGDRIDRVQWCDAVLLVEYLHLIEIR